MTDNGRKTRLCGGCVAGWLRQPGEARLSRATVLATMASERNHHDLPAVIASADVRHKAFLQANRSYTNKLQGVDKTVVNIH